MAKAKTGRKKKACWRGYRKEGMKMKGGRKVNNCVKIGEKKQKTKNLQ